MKDKKRILIFSTAYYPFVGGAEVSIKEITDELGDFGFDLITAKMKKDLPDVEKIGRVTVYRLGSGRPLLDRLLVPFRGAKKAWQLAAKNNYLCFWGVMVTYATGAAYMCNIYRNWLGKKKIPMVLSLQEGDSETHLRYRWGGLIHLSWKMALKRTDYLTGLSTFLLHRAEMLGYDGLRALVPNGVDIKFFSKPIGPKIRQEIKKSLGKKDGDIFLVTTSRLVRKNATDDTIRALKLLPSNIRFIVIGKGPDWNKLHELAATLGLAHRVTFLGFIEHKDFPRYLSACDMFIRPSRSEGFGVSFVEAMAAGLPVIATPIGGIPDFIDDKETGIFCSPDNPQSIAKAVELLMKDTLLREKIAEKGKYRVMERYSWEKIAQDMKAVFDTL